MRWAVLLLLGLLAAGRPAAAETVPTLDRPVYPMETLFGKWWPVSRLTFEYHGELTITREGFIWEKSEAGKGTFKDLKDGRYLFTYEDWFAHPEWCNYVVLIMKKDDNIPYLYLKLKYFSKYDGNRKFDDLCTERTVERPLRR